MKIFLRLLPIKIITLPFILLLWKLTAFSQKPIGQIGVTSYSRFQYAAGTQNWALTQDARGRIYAANNEGLLVYDGTNWQLFPVPNKTIIRSIAFAPDGKLYAGAQDEFGYYYPDETGRLHFTSLKSLLTSSEKNFTDVWEVKAAGTEVFFRTYQKIFCFSGNKISVHTPASSWLSLFEHNGQMLAQDEQTGLHVYQNNQWQTFIEKSLLPAGFVITGTIPYHKDTSLLCTTKSGLFLLAQNHLLPFTLAAPGTMPHYTSLAAVDDNNFLAGTYSDGIYQISHQRNVLEKIDSKNGLQNNTVRCLHTDKSGNVWTGLDNGIAFFAYNNAIKHINPQSFNNGSGYNIKYLNGDLYFALSTGLQYLPVASATDLSAINDEPKAISGGQTWNLSVIGNQLLAGRDDGLWKISQHKAELVSSAAGYWGSEALPHTSPVVIAAGNYRGVHLYQQENDSFSDKGPIKNFSESSRYMETDDQNIWVSHPYRGVYKISLSNFSVTLYSLKKGLPADLDNHVFKIKNQIVFATTKGVYEYNAAEDKMIPARQYAALFGEMPIRYLKEDEKGNIWFVQDKMVGVADYSGSKPVIHYITELKNRILSGFENIYPYNIQNIFIGSERGFYHINYDKYRQNIQPPKPYITLVQITGIRDSVLYGGYTFFENGKEKKVNIPYKWNSLRFRYAASVFGQQQAEYSYYLQGFDKTWSAWSERPEKDYTNLPEGTYTFRLKARNGLSSLGSAESVYTFIVSPPWYRSISAYIFYFTVLVVLLYAIFKSQERKHRKKQEERQKADQKKFKEEQRQMAYQHQLALEHSENELMRLRNENLETEIEFKNAELAGNAMNLVQKKEFLLKIADELNKLNKSGKDSIEMVELKKILRSIASQENLDEEWKQFSIHFNKVHSNFLITLKNKFPNLNAHELKLCAYLRMNLTSKEMARLMSISVRGVEISRYRLRKKLQLQPKEDLFQFLLDI